MTKRRSARRAALPAQGRAVTLATAKAPTNEKGSTGEIAWGGVLSGLSVDYAEAWQLPKRWQTVASMVADPAVTATLAALTYPILAAPLNVEAASDDPDDRRYAEFVEENLSGMTTTLARHRAEAMGCIGEGVRLFETVYEKREDDLYHLRKLALRPNKTVLEWKVDDTGGPDGVTQLRTDGTSEHLEMDRLLAFTHMGDGPSLLGKPATRAMYRPWWLIDRVSRAGAVAIDRHGAGVPWAQYVGNNADERRKVEHALMGLHTNERSFLLWNLDVAEWGIKGVEGATLDPVPFMEYQRRDLFLAPLAQFLALGTDSVGSMALSQDHSSFFMMALRFIAQEIEDTYNSYLVPRLIGYNWTVPAERLPRVVHGTLDQRNATSWAGAVAAIVGAGVSLPADELTRVAGELLGVTIPEAQAAGADVADVNDPNAPEPGDMAAGQWALVNFHGSHDQKSHGRRKGASGGGGGGDIDELLLNLAADDDNSEDLAATGLQSPALLSSLGIAVDFAAMSERLDGAEAAIVKALAPLQAKARAVLLNQAKEIIQRGDPDGLAKIVVKSDREQAALEALLAAVYDFGAEQVGSELESQGATSQAPTKAERAASLALLGMAAAELARSLADRMRTALGTAVVDQMRTGYDRAALDAAVTAPGERLLADVARRGPTVALGMGRADAVTASGVNEVLYSAAMDAVTCTGPAEEMRCKELDGTRYPAGTPGLVPNRACRGGWKCRCILIPVVE